MKTSRIPSLQNAPRERFGLRAIVDSKRVILPLKGIECDFSVVSGIAEVSMTQIFRQDNVKPLDCEYLFPLPADASVYFCEANINGRIVRAQVREAHEARRIAAEKKAEGFRTALVEAVRENLFNLGLGNVQPNDLVIIRIKYFQTLRFLAGLASIEIPLCPGIRYIPGTPLLRSNKGKGTVDDTDQVPDASRITPVRIDADHPDAAYIEVQGTLDGKFVNESDLASPSHPIVVDRAGELMRVSLLDKGEVPDRDFVLRWSEQNVGAVTSRAWVCEKDQETYALLEIRAPKEAPTGRLPADFYFLVDRSGSMKGQKWTKAAQALQSCMRVLGPDDRAMVTFFENRFRDFAERPLKAQELLEDRQFQRVVDLGAAGGTELRPALEHVLELAARHSRKNPKNLILITDAQIGNESAIVELMKTAPDFPVHCFGIDVALNDSLLLALCRQQGGSFHSLNSNDDIERAVTSLGKTLGQPVLLDLQLVGGWELADARIPNLYAGQIHYLSARSLDSEPLRIRAHGAAAESLEIKFEKQSVSLEAPWLHWCRSRIQRLLAEGKEAEAVALSVKSNLVCTLTAFVAWDESEKVPIAIHELVQPNMPVYFGSAKHFMLAEFSQGYAPARESLLKSASRKFRVSAGTIPRGGAPDSSALRDASIPDELDLMRKISDLCHRTGLVDWERLVQAIWDWVAQASGVERSRRLASLAQLVRKLELEVDRYEMLQTRADREELADARDRIQFVLSEFWQNLRVTNSAAANSESWIRSLFKRLRSAGRERLAPDEECFK